MKQTRTQKIILAGILSATAVIGSLLSIPVLGARATPVQHIVNVLCAVLLGPSYGVAVAFIASLLRNIFGMGTVLAFPGSMIGAFLCGIVFAKTRNLLLTCLGEVLGTGILGGLAAWPLAILLLGADVGNLAFYVYVIPFLISTAVGSVIAYGIITVMKRSNALPWLKDGESLRD